MWNWVAYPIASSNLFLHSCNHTGLLTAPYQATAVIHFPHSLPRGRQRKKSRTPRGEISWNQVEIMRNLSRFPWNQARKSAQPSSSTHFYNIWRHFWGKSWGNQREIRKSRTPKLLVADPSLSPSFSFPTSPPPSNCCANITPHKSSNSLHSITRHKSETLSIIASRTLPLIFSDPPSKVLEETRILRSYSHGSSLIETLQPEVTYACAIFSRQVWIIKAVNCRALAVGK